MLELKISAMSCGHCVRAVTEAVQAVDPQATVQVDLPSKTARIESSADRQALLASLAEAGYSPDPGQGL
jgi:copper chaperone